MPLKKCKHRICLRKREVGQLPCQVRWSAGRRACHVLQVNYTVDWSRQSSQHHRHQRQSHLATESQQLRDRHQSTPARRCRLHRMRSWRACRPVWQTSGREVVDTCGGVSSQCGWGPMTAATMMPATADQVQRSDVTTPLRFHSQRPQPVGKRMQRCRNSIIILFWLS